VIRQPVADETLPTPEATGFAVPELPLAINLANLEIELARFGPTVFGLESELAMQGRLRLEGGSLDTALEIQRLDGPGGQLSLTAQYANETQIIDLDLALSEPQDGVVANLLDIQGRPPIDLTIAGAGPISELDIELTLDADAERVLTGLADAAPAGRGPVLQYRARRPDRPPRPGAVPRLLRRRHGASGTGPHPRRRRPFARHA
jgi:translocation and assembly module TamB